jgi:outer membrane biosynthesis protein TonB
MRIHGPVTKLIDPLLGRIDLVKGSFDSARGPIDRRAFTVEAALALLAGVAITISACGTNNGPGGPTAVVPDPTPTPGPTPTPTPSPTASPSPTPKPTPGPTPTPRPTPTPAPTPSPTPTPMADKLGAISANHGHVARITGAQLTAGGALSLDIQGAASHTHTVTLSAAEVMDIAQNHKVSKVSTTDSFHNHTVTFN